MYWKELKSFFDSWNIKHPAGMSEACWFQGLFLAFCVCTDMRPSLIVLRNKARWMCLWNTFFLVRRLFQKMFDLSQLGHFPVSWRLVENKALEKIKMSHVCNGIMNDRVWLNGKPAVAVSQVTAKSLWLVLGESWWQGTDRCKVNISVFRLKSMFPCSVLCCFEYRWPL